MNCPKCGSQLDKHTIKCQICGARIGRFCPVCKEYNLITNKNCTSCGEVLLKICPKCKSINLPAAKLCRKCGADIDIKKEIQKDEQQIQDTVYSANYYSLTGAKDTIMSAIKTSNIKIISINGDNEYGKNYVFQSLVKETAANNIAWLMGKCNPHTQLTPLGYMQSVLLNLFNITNFCSDKKLLKKESIKFFKQDFENLSTKEIYDLLNILYPENIDSFQNIQNNKQNTIRIIVKIFETILGKMNTVLLVENIEYIDSFSYELLNILISNDLIREKLTILLTCSKEQSGANCITSPFLEDNNYVDVTIAPFTREQIEPIFTNYSSVPITKDIKNNILKSANDNPILVEQLINLVSDSISGNKPIIYSDNLQDVIKYRLNLLKEADNFSYMILCACTILGFKFHPIILTGIFNIYAEDIEKRMSQLVKSDFITPSFNFGYEFKTLNLWNIMIELFKQDTEIFKVVNQSLYPLVANYILSTSAILGFIAQNLDSNDQTFAIWSHCVQLAAYIGDTSLYIILQKQILNIIDKVNIAQADIVKRTIYTELGKLLEPDNPQLAMEYLPKAVTMLDEGHFVEKIELLGYLASASMKLNNYQGVIECVNNVIPLIPDSFPVEVAIMKSREITPLLKLGNTGAIINLIDNDILPILENALTNKLPCKTISQDTIFEIWVKTQLNLAKALIMQGDNRAFKILEDLSGICNANNIQNYDFLTNIKTYMAFANTMSGNIRMSIKILDEILSNTNEEINDYTMSTINLISILNRFFMNKNDLSYEELFQAAQYADDINDEFTKNILKILLGRLIQDRTSAKEAAVIYTKQVEYFAEKQNAIGVLLGWYFISQAKMLIDGPNAALDIALKALDISQSVNINNNYFTLILNKLIGEIYLALQDFDAAKMYIEKAIMIAKSSDIKYQLAHLYLLYSKYLQDYALTIQDKKVDYILSAQQMNQKASSIADDLKLISLMSEVEKATTILNSFCQMNGIVLK